MERFCLALDLRDDPALIREYEEQHRAVWPEILDSLKASGVLAMEIFRTGNRLFMILEAGPEFSLERKARMDQDNPRVRQWEELMWHYQQAVPWAVPGQKWVLMEKVFEFNG